MNGARRVFLVVSSMQGGGAERVAATLANCWVGEGWEVTLVVTFSGRGKCFYTLDSRVSQLYLADLVRDRVSGWRSKISRLARLRRLIERERPDVVVSFLPHVNVAAIAASLGTGTPVIVSERTNPALDVDATRMQRLLRRVFYRFADAVVIQTQSVECAVRASAPGAARFEVIPNPVPPALPVGRQFGSGAGRHRLVACGRLVPEKQFRELIEHFVRISRERADWDLWIWGDGPEESELRRTVESLGLSGRVFIQGRTDDIWGEMLRADIFVLVSAFEGFPNSLLEAMALGVPSVAFDCDFGPREITGDGKDAMLVPANDWPALENVLRELFDDPASRAALGKKGAAAVREKFSLNHVLQRWASLFDTMIKLHRAR